MTEQSYAGGCSCGEVRYQLIDTPLFVHCCHCLWCQRESGSAFALNALIEADRVQLLQGQPVATLSPSESGKGQTFWRCASCNLALWSHYGGAGPSLNFVRLGTLDEPDRFPPDVHIYTASKQTWLPLPEDVPAFSGYYDARKHWPQASLARRAAQRDCR